jgi:ATP-dependent Lhr-like helicase
VNAFDRLHPALQHHIVNSLGWSELRSVQNLSIDGYLDGDNLVVLAPTAGGKTEAAFFPIISQMLTESWSGLSVLYVSPIRALLNNQEERLRRYFQLLGRRAACWHGDTAQVEKRRMRADPPDCLLVTPESLEVILVSAHTDHRQFFHHVRAVVIDELHSFAADDRGWHLLSVLARIGRLAGRDIQRIGLSATVGNPDEMLDWLSAGSARSKRVIRPEATARTPSEVQLDYVGSLQNAAKVIRLLHPGEKRLVFCDSRSRVEQLAVLLRQGGTDTFVSHSSLSLEERRSAEQAFSSRQNCVIVATSSLELGLDVGDLDRVIQIDAPPAVSSFLQRMGRTGRRAGTTSNCLFLATSDEGLLRAASLLDLWQDGYVEPVETPPEPLHILAQQLMALVLQEGGVGRSDWLDWISTVPAFATLAPRAVADLVDFMVRTRVLWDDHGLLSFAPEGEAEYGRQNFMDLLSVFTSPPLFRVVSGQTELGSVHESTFYKRKDGAPVLVLGGQNWKAKHVDWRRRVAHVEPAGEERGRSRWLGEGQFLGHRVCQRIQKLLAADVAQPVWSKRATAQMAEIRSEYPWVAIDTTSIVRHPNGEIRWWTFAGGVANTLLADHVRSRCDAKVDNLALRFPSTTNLSDVEALVRSLSATDIRPVPQPEALDNLKFSECLPPDLAAAVFASRFNDTAAISDVLSKAVRVLTQD